MQPSLKMNVETSPPKYFCLCTKKPSFHFLLFQFRISGLLGCVPAAIGKKGSTLDRLSVSCRVYTCAWTWIIPSIHLYIHFFPTYPILGLEPIPAVVQREAWYPLDRSPICCRARPWMNHPYHRESSVFVFCFYFNRQLSFEVNVSVGRMFHVRVVMDVLETPYSAVTLVWKCPVMRKN